jgi:hypothetical protein
MLFTYRSARAGSLVFGLGLAIVVETCVVHLVLHARHPLLAWGLTVASVSTLAWLAADYRALGRGTIRVDRDGIDLRVGRRASARVPLSALESVVQPTWQQIPAAGEAGSADYRNLMKPAPPNVLVTVGVPTVVRLTGGRAPTVRRLGLRLDDPAGFIAAVETACASLGDAAQVGRGR